MRRWPHGKSSRIYRLRNYGSQIVNDRLEHNLKLIPVHQGIAGAFVWIPVGVLFTRARFDLDGAILLASLYYLFVVVLEVPSGWVSDRFGRVPTMRFAALCWMVAHTLVVVGDDWFPAIAASQFFMASGFSALSGTDVSLHYDSLEALGRADEYQRRQARVSAIGYGATSLATLIGGFLGWINLRVPFAVAIGLAIVQLGVASQLAEPPSRPGQQAASFPGQIQQCLRYLRGRWIGWLFFYGIALVTLEHVAVTLLQPWLTEALGQTADELGTTPILAGVVFAVVSFVGAGAARASDPVSRRFGVPATLIWLGVLSSIIVTAMALSTSVFVLGLVALRSVQGAAAPVLLSSAVAPVVGREHRATFLSLNSLAGRLGYGVILLVVASGVDDRVGPALGALTAIAWALVVALLVSVGFARSGADAQRADGGT